MTIRNHVRSWLGITEIQEDQALLHQKLQSLDWVQAQVSAITLGLDKIVAKLDPEREFNPITQAASDIISKAATKRLHAEALARAPYNHNLGDDQ